MGNMLKIEGHVYFDNTAAPGMHVRPAQQRKPCFFSFPYNS